MFDILHVMVYDVFMTLAIGRKGVKKHWKLIDRLLAQGVQIKVVAK